MLQLALNGTGLAILASFQVKNHIKAGRLVAVLENYNSGETESLYAVFLDQGKFHPARIRVFDVFVLIEKTCLPYSTITAVSTNHVRSIYSKKICGKLLLQSP